MFYSHDFKQKHITDKMKTETSSSTTQMTKTI